MKNQKMKCVLLTILLLIFCKSTVFSQILIPQRQYYLQPYATPMHLNPAFTGIQQNPRIGFNNYFLISSGTNFGNFNPIQANLNYDQQLDVIKSGFGVTANYVSARSGNFITTSISGLYSYEAKINDDFMIRAGLNISWNNNIQKQLMVRNPMPVFSPVQPQFPASNNYFNFGAGALVLLKSVYAGFATQNIFEPELQFSADPIFNRVESRRYNIHFGGFIFDTGDLKKGWMFHPNFMFDIHREISVYSAGLNISKSRFSVGISYNDNGSNHFMRCNFGLIFNHLKFGYATTLLNRDNNYQQELSLIYHFNKPKDIRFNKMANHFRRVF